jgi:hypothetical protein
VQKKFTPSQEPVFHVCNILIRGPDMDPRISINRLQIRILLFFFVDSRCLINKVHWLSLKRNNLLQSHKTVEIKGFSIFLLVDRWIQRQSSICTNNYGWGFGRPTNLWLLRIRIRNICDMWWRSTLWRLLQGGTVRGSIMGRVKLHEYNNEDNIEVLRTEV